MPRVFERLQSVKQTNIVAGAALLLILISLGLRLRLLTGYMFGPDEFQHLHSSWCISKGLVTYRDYFDHHTPLFHQLLSPLFRFYQVETNAGDAVAFIVLARRLMWVLAAASLMLTFILTRVRWGGRAAWVATAFLACNVMFLERTLEVRPEVLMVTLLLGSFLATVCGLRSGEPSRHRTLRQFAGGGFLLGASIMCSTKALFVLPSFAVSMLWYVLDQRLEGTRKLRFRAVLALCLGLCVPIFVTMAYYAFHQGLHEFIEYNFAMNSRWKSHFSPAANLQQLVGQSPFEVALAATGFLRSLLHLFRRDSVRAGDFFLVLTAGGLFAGLFVIPVPHQQYFLMFIPLGAMFAGKCAIENLDAVANWRSVPWTRRLEGLVFSAILALFLTLAVREARPAAFHLESYPLLWLAALLVMFPLLLFRVRNATLAILLMLMSVYPLKQMEYMFGFSNSDKLDEIRYVINNTTPTDTVLDGFSGSGVFRPHAYYYYFLHYEQRAMMTPDQRNDFANDLRTGRMTPSLVLLDDQLAPYSRSATAYICNNYHPSGNGAIWLRNSLVSREDPVLSVRSPNGVNEEGYITRWLMLEPVSLPNDAGNYPHEWLEKELLPGLISGNPDETVSLPVSGKNRKWRLLDGMPDGTIDFEAFAAGSGMAGAHNALYLAACYLQSSADVQDIVLAIESDENTLWLLDEMELLRGRPTEGASQTRSRPFTLTRGTHILRMVVINAKGGSSARARMLDRTGKPVRSIASSNTITPPDSR